MSAGLSSIRLLHVDDEPEVTDLAADYLENEDERFTVETARDAEEGLEYLRENGFDCIVSDYDMPGLNGIEFLQAVREEHPDLPFILFTGKGSEEVASEAISKGVTDYLQKETGLSQYTVLLNRIENAVGQYHIQRELERERAESAQLLEWLDHALTATDTYVWQWDLEADEIQRHPSTEHVLGIESDAIGGVHEGWIEYVHPDDRAAAEQTITEGIESGEGYEVTCRIETEDGSTRWVRDQAEVETETDEPIEAIGTVSDVTAQKKRELELQRAQRRTDFALQATDAYIFEIDYASGEEHRHGAWESIHGISSEEVPSTEAWLNQAVHPDDREKIGEIYEDFDVEPGARLQFDYRTNPEHGEVRNVRSRLEVQADPIAGSLRAIGLSRDITDRKEREARLETERQRFRTLFDKLTQPAVEVEYVDSEPIVREVNSAFVDAFGYEEASLVGESLDQFIVPEDREEEAKSINQRVQQGGRLVSEKVTRLTADGPREFLLQNAVYEDGSGGFAVYLDITDREERRAELRHLKQEYETVFETAQDAIFLFDVEQSDSGYEFRLRRLNPAHEAISGLSSEADRGKTPVELLGEEAGTEVEANYRRCVEAGEPISYEEVLDMPDGTVHWHTILAPVEQGGEVTQIVGVARDITDQKQTEQERHRTDGDHELVFEHVQDSLFLANVAGPPDDPEFRLGRLNRTNRELFELAEHEAQGRTPTEVFGEDVGSQITANYKQCYDAERPISYEERLELPGGERVFQTTLTPVDVDGDIEHIVGIAHDVTEQREARA